MFKLAGKLLFCSSFVFIYLINTTTLAQPKFIAYACIEESGNFITNSTYRRNLDTTLAALPTTNSGFGFYNRSTGQGNDRVNSIALCRGDVNPDVCRSCVNDSIVRLREICPNQREAVGYYDNCLLKYSNETILGNTRIRFDVFYANPQNSSDEDSFNSRLRPLMNRLRDDASAGGPLLKFAIGNTTGPGLSTIYGLQQCTPDLSELECSNCLEGAVNRFVSNGSNSGKVGGRALLPMCNFRYEIHQFYNVSDTVIPPPPSSSPPPPPPPPPPENHGRKLGLILGLSIGAMATLIVIIVIIVCFRRKLRWGTKAKSDVNVEMFLKNHEFLAPKRYSYSQVKKMTNSFKVKLGQGSFGSVYKGALSNGTLVAVKVLSELKGKGEDFINEVKSVGMTSHVNIVSLLGFCLEGHQRALIYEFMPNGSLEKFIYGWGSSSNSQLAWGKLQQIAIGIAKGLEYLHSGCNKRILHFDIKPHNILLDQDFCPKISDFGLAKLFPDKRSIISVSGIRGTPGYIAPEVHNRRFGQVSHKADVYSYGRMILKMVEGRKNIEGEDEHTSEIDFPDWIYKKVELNEEKLGLHGIVSDEENEMARKMIIVGLWCIQTNPLSRPKITKVLEMLEGDLASMEIPPKPYLFSPSTN